MDRSARESLTTFMAGQGDVMIGYENEAIFAQQMGQPIDFVIPESSTMLIENPVAVTTVGDALEPATAFVDFLYTPEAQRVFGQKGFRPVVEEVARRVRLSRRSPTSSASRTWVAGRRPDRASSTLTPASWPASSPSSVATRHESRLRDSGRRPGACLHAV